MDGSGFACNHISATFHAIPEDSPVSRANTGRRRAGRSPVISVVGVTHKTAPLEVRERFAFGNRTAVGILRSVPFEAFLLVTCNRCELYGTAAATVLRQVLLDAAGAPGQTPLMAHEGPAAVRHLLAVAAGLDSMVVGEPQILGQVRQALALAAEAGRLGPVLSRLGQHALICGRRVRRETALGRGQPSVPRVAAGVVRHVLSDLSGRVVVVVGAGEMGALAARTFGQAGAQVVVASRTARSAEEAARSAGGQAAVLDELDALLERADAAIFCTGSPAPVLGVERVRRIMEARGSRPLVVVDVALPRDVAPDVRDVEGVRLYDLDDLRAHAPAPLALQAVEAAWAVVEQETERFLRWMSSRRAVPAIQALRRRADAIVEEEVARAGGDPEALRRFGQRVVNRLLHHPVVRMRERAGAGALTYLEIARDLFGLDGAQGDG